MINGVEKTRTVIKDGSFQYLKDDAGKVVTEGITLFSGDGKTGFFNYMYNGIVNSSAMDIIAFLLVVGVHLESDQNWCTRIRLNWINSQSKGS